MITVAQKNSDINVSPSPIFFTAAHYVLYYFIIVQAVNDVNVTA